MSLQQYLGRSVDAHIRARGRDYFRMGAVAIERGDAWAVRAHVRGTDSYQVDLLRDSRDEIAAWCTCPYAGRAELCKHIWAVVLAADASALLQGNGSSAQVIIGLAAKRIEQALDERDAPGSLDDDDDVDSTVEDRVDEDDVDEEGGDAPVDPDGDSGAELFAYEWEEMIREARRRNRATRPPPGANARQRTGRSTPPLPAWRRALARLPAADADPAPVPPPRGGVREICYIVDAYLTASAGALVVEVGWRDRKGNGDWSPPKTRTFLGEQLVGAMTPEDETALRMLCGLSHRLSYGGGHRDDLRSMLIAQPNHVHVPGPLVAAVMPLICATGRCRVRSSNDELGEHALAWDDGPPWTLSLDFEVDAAREVCRLDYSLRRGDAQLRPWDVVVVTADGHVLTPTHLARVEHRGGFGWLPLLHASGAITAPIGDAETLVGEIIARPGAPDLALPPGLALTEARPRPQPRLFVRPAGSGRPGDETLHGDVIFTYDGVDLPWNKAGDRVFLADRRTILTRDREDERAALAQVAAAGLRPVADVKSGQARWTLAAKRLPEAVRALTARGWIVEATGRVYRQAKSTRTAVRSGIDWFDLEGAVDFGGVSASIADVVAALAKGEQTVTLGDGSLGLLPEDWLARHSRWTTLGERQGDAVRFTRSQAALLDALLAGVPEVDVDEQFSRVRRELASFEGIRPAEAPAGFHGELRAYQREGLGWIRFLERFGLGGCLADDMGLGKTVQVLAALCGRRAADPSLRPSLVVVPRSLVFNWLREAARFAPGLRLLDHTGASRTRSFDDLDEVDVVVTTYGTLRRDAAQLAEVEFDYVVLDEAHAIKNVDSLTAKTVRLLRGRNRLALTGTPVQNHVGDLWSLFEFLNPGLLGRSTAFTRMLDRAALDPEGRRLLARIVRPFILRRSKADVAPDLPERLEDTIVCRLDRDERVFYDGLRAHYREQLKARIEQDGWGRARILVLEALLRLRQAACHPGLVDANWKSPSSAKLDVLVSHLREVREEGHKAIVFSQFVTLLDRVRAALDRDGVTYEYLDGRTRDREARVDRFQQDPACSLFLVSLKAGGLGLNLTAAEYVFLLDPWWNPAVEAQAIDRAHRIGQTRQVFAYRLIAENTIEQKVLELQARKRDLAEAIVGQDATGLAHLTREDLELLLS